MKFSRTLKGTEVLAGLVADPEGPEAKLILDNFRSRYPEMAHVPDAQIIQNMITLLKGVPSSCSS